VSPYARTSEPFARINTSFVSAAAPAEHPVQIDTALRLTAIALLLRPMGPWFARPVILGAAALALISPRALRCSTLWFGVAIAIAVRIADDWPLADNHIYLLAYWSLAIALSLRDSQPARTLAFNSRCLVGLAFTLAVLWKAILSPDFLDGRFFRVTLLTDPRLGEAAMLIGGLTQQQLDDNRAALAPLPHGAELLNPPPVIEPPRLRAFGIVSTWGILCLEASVAILMLLPTRRLTAALRHAALLVFCCATYAFAPVAGFGWLLLVMGLAQTSGDQIHLRRIYVVVFLGVLFYSEVPWASLLLERLR
jgi:hypothetical protein